MKRYFSKKLSLVLNLASLWKYRRDILNEVLLLRYSVFSRV